MKQKQQKQQKQQIIKKLSKPYKVQELYMSIHEHTGLIKCGVSITPDYRALKQHNNRLLKREETNEAYYLEKKIQKIYKDFRVPLEEALSMGVAPNGGGEYFRFSEQQARYVLDWAVGNSYLWPVSPFAEYWLSTNYLIKLSEPVIRRNPNSLKAYQKSRACTIIPENVDKLIEDIGIDGVQNPLLINAESKVLSGNNRLYATIKIGLSQIPVIIADSCWLGIKEQEDLAVLLNTSKFNVVCIPLTPSDIQFDLRKLMLAYKKKSTKHCGSTEKAFAYFNKKTQLDLLAQKYRKSKKSIATNLSHVFKKLQESEAIEAGLFEHYDSGARATVLANAAKNHVSRACVVHVASKISDAVGQCIRAMITENKKAGLILTYRSWKDMDRSYSNNLTYLAQLKKNLGLDIILQEVNQVATSAVEEEIYNG